MNCRVDLKSPNIILNDSNMDTALEQATNSVFFNTGQNCIAGSRLFVQERVYDEFVEKITKYVKNQVVDYPFEEKSDQGPLVDVEGYEKYKRYIDLGKKEGAKMTTGGNTLKRKGYWVEPTIFCDVKDDMRIAKEEIFSPVMSILKFKSLDEVIERANNTPYGLGAGIVGNNISEVNYLINALKVGNIYVNTYNAEDVGTPFGGVKNSGVGRDLGELGLQQYVEPKTVIINNNI